MKPRGDEWFIRKAEYYQRHPRQCAACGSVVRIHLHHIRYSAGIGREPDDDLVPLCEDHHNEVHRVNHRNIASLPEATQFVIESVSGKPWAGVKRHKIRGSTNQRIIANQQARIRELEAENERLRDELRVAVVLGGPPPRRPDSTVWENDPA